MFFHEHCDYPEPMKMPFPAAPIEPFWMPMNQDKKIEELMEQAYKEEKQMQYYDHALMEQMSDEQDKKRIYQIYMDQRKHCKMFEEMYYRMTARKPEDHHKKPALTHDIKKDMDKRIFMAIEYVEFYRKIYFLVYPIEFKQMLYEMITDEQNHAIKYMHLYQKY